MTGSGSAVRAGIHAGLGRSGKGERVRIDKTGQEGVLRENPQPCCPLLPHLALAATSRSRSREVHGRPSRITGCPRRAPCPSSWSNDVCAEVPDRRENSCPSPPLLSTSRAASFRAPLAAPVPVRSCPPRACSCELSLFRPIRKLRGWEPVFAPVRGESSAHCMASRVGRSRACWRAVAKPALAGRLGSA